MKKLLSVGLALVLLSLFCVMGFGVGKDSRDDLLEKHALESIISEENTQNSSPHAREENGIYPANPFAESPSVTEFYFDENGEIQEEIPDIFHDDDFYYDGEYYDNEIYDDDYLYEEDYDDDYFIGDVISNGMAVIVVLFLAFFTVIVHIGLIIAVVILAFKNSQYKNKIKQYEMLLNAIQNPASYTVGTPVNNQGAQQANYPPYASQPTAYNTQPVPQPIQQPVSQPVEEKTQNNETEN